MKPWPLSIPHQPTPEEIREYEEIIRKVEAGEMQWQPLSPEKAARFAEMRRPVSASIHRMSENEFKAEMRCRGCGAQITFDHNSPPPWAAIRDQFHQTHDNH